MKKFTVFFRGGEARDGMTGCNYMITNCLSRSGDEVELYAEYLMPDVDGEFDCDEFDEVSYPELKAEILRQAKKYDVAPEALGFE